jgi:MerR family copper efflux transcriptional regulator
VTPESSPRIACTLAPGEMPRRGEEIRSLGRDGLRSVVRAERRVTLRFGAGPEIRRRVEEIAAAESRCCAFLGFTVADEDDATVLTIDAPEGGEPVMHELAGLFEAGLRS